uniref:Sema domain-containing protein n=1 Tax=Tetranychus urticae TaxID=32264 RepID=T1KSE2_TETUR
MKCLNYHQARILCLFILHSPVAITMSKPYRSAANTYKYQVFPVEGMDNFYTIYVAGEVVTVEIDPEAESDPKKILEWRVVNTNKSRLMFITTNGFGYVLYNKTYVKPVKRPSGYLLSGNFIMLGDNKVIHAQLVLEYSTDPFTYLDLLYFNESSQEPQLEIVDQIKWFTSEDGKHLSHWNILTHIFIGDKLYIAIGRDLVAQGQISIMRLCLNQGDAILSSAVEVYFEAEFAAKAYFVYKLGKLDDESKRFSLLVERNYAGQQLVGSYERYFIDNYSTIFDEVAENCAKGVDGYITMHDVITFNNKGCQPRIVTTCSFPKFYIPSYKLNLEKHLEPKTMLRLFVIHDGYPFEETRFIFLEGISFYDCPLSSINAALSPECTPKYPYDINRYFFYFNYITSTLFWLDQEAKTFGHTNFNCERFKDCFSCIMFGYNSKCTWDNVYCKSNSSFVDATSASVNFCFKITNFKPRSLAEGSKSKRIFINFIGVPDWRADLDFKIYVKIGSDSCDKLTFVYEPEAGYKVICQMDIRRVGKFKINVTFAYEHYGNSIPIVAISNNFITFRSAGQTDGTILFAQIFALFLVFMVFFIAVLFIFCPCDGKGRKRARKRLSSEISLRMRSISRTISGINHKSMNPKLKWKLMTRLKGKSSSESSRSGSRY